MGCSGDSCSTGYNYTQTTQCKVSQYTSVSTSGLGLTQTWDGDQSQHQGKLGGERDGQSQSILKCPFATIFSREWGRMSFFAWPHMSWPDGKANRYPERIGCNTPFHSKRETRGY